MDTQNTTLDLAVVRQQLTELAHAQVTLEQVEANLTPIYNAALEAGDENTQALLTQAWNSAVEIANHANQAMALAEGVTTAAESLRQQRDAMVTEHAELIEAIDHLDYDHPVVQEFYDSVNDEVWDNVMQNGCYVSDCPACDITVNSTNEYIQEHLNHDTAGIFFNLLMGDPEEALTDKLAKELCDFVIAFVNKVHAHAKAEAAAS